MEGGVAPSAKREGLVIVRAHAHAGPGAVVNVAPRLPLALVARLPVHPVGVVWVFAGH